MNAAVCKNAMDQGYADLAHKLHCSLPHTGTSLWWPVVFGAIFLVAGIMLSRVYREPSYLTKTGIFIGLALATTAAALVVPGGIYAAAGFAILVAIYVGDQKYRRWKWDRRRAGVTAQEFFDRGKQE